MTTTPLMSLVLPVEQGSTDVWGPILATVFGLIDGHDHTTGKGAQVPMGGLKVDADLSFSFGGTSRAITDLRAIDFSPQAASGMTALAGALFLNSSDNNLYYRTTSGTNIQVTNGAALNVAGFSGGIGGDYSGVSALVDFVDSTDTYRFRQQVGASVQQYARMQCADLDLFEFKAHPATPVPTTRVRLASPTSLASSYALTLPTALPASTLPLTVSAAGVMAYGALPPQRQFAAGVIAGSGDSSQGLGGLALNTSSDSYAPLILAVGEVLTSWTMFLQKASSSGTLSAKLFDLTLSSGSSSQIGSTQSNSTPVAGAIQLGQAGLSTTVAAGHAYFIQITGTGNAGDTVRGYQITNT